MNVHPYLCFNGNCEAAFTFYQRCLGGTLGPIFRYAETPAAEDLPADWQQKIMHGSVTVGDQTLMGADVAADDYEPPKGFSLSVHLKSPSEAERIFRELADGGTVGMALQKTFWATRFGTVVDRFGIPWLINCEGPE